MSRVLADTSAYSAFLRGHPGVGEALRVADEIRVTPIVLGELRAGHLRGSRRQTNEEQLRFFLTSPRVGILSIDEETAERYAVIVSSLRAAGTMISTIDAWIAASAMQHGLTVLTTDADFLRIPQILVDHQPAS
jgi:predicted nucleic acid-binding protein